MEDPDDKKKKSNQEYYALHQEEIRERMKASREFKKLEKLRSNDIPYFLEPYIKVNKNTFTLNVPDVKGLLGLCELICANTVIEEGTKIEEKKVQDLPKNLRELGIPPFFEPYIKVNKCSYSLATKAIKQDLENLCRIVALRYPSWKSDQKAP